MATKLVRDPMFDDDAPDTDARKVNRCAQHGAYSQAVDRCPRCPKGAEPVKPVVVKRRVAKEVNVLATPERCELPIATTGRGKPRWEAPILAALRAAPGAWHRVAEFEDGKHATSNASGARKAKGNAEFEFAARGSTVFARYVGKAKR